MATKKLAISLDGELVKQVRRAAKAHARGNVSAWLADAARVRLRQIAAKEALRAYEAQAGEIGEHELRAIRREWPLA